jgi:hypothetical protein
VTVAGYAAIAEVGETLVGLLRDRIDETEGSIGVDRSEVGLISPGEMGENGDLRLSLYLYRVTESGELNNAERTQVGEETYREPPLALDLYYLLTAHPSTGGADETDRTSQQHQVLGLAMQVMRDNAVVEGPDLRGSLTEDRELRVSLYPQSLDEVTNLWSTFPETPFRPSVCYLVSPVLIESTREEEVPPVRESVVELSDDPDPFNES